MTITAQTDYAGIEAALVAWLETYSGVGAGKVIFANQATPRPAKPYASVLLTSMGIAFGTDEQRESFNVGNDNIDRETVGVRQMVAQVDVYTNPGSAADEARPRLQNALQALDLERVIEAFRAVGLASLDHTSINAPDEQIGERWERRAQADVTLLYTASTLETAADGIDPIETVEAPTEGGSTLIIGE